MSGWAIGALSSIIAQVLAVFFEDVDNRIEISLWDGTIKLRCLALKPTAISALELPAGEVDVSGFVGEILVAVPWRTLFGSPVRVSIDRVYLVAKGVTSSAADAPFNATTFAAEAAAALQNRLAAWQQLEDARQQAGSAPGASPASKSLVDRIVGFAASRIRVAITNVHVRVEDSQDAHAGEPLVLGMLLRGLTLGGEDAAEQPADAGVESPTRSSGSSAATRESESRDDVCDDVCDDGGRSENAGRVVKVVEVRRFSVYVGDGDGEETSPSSMSARGAPPANAPTAASATGASAPAAAATAAAATAATAASAASASSADVDEAQALLSAQWETLMRPRLVASSSSTDVLQPLSLRLRLSLDFNESLAATSAWVHLSLASPLALTLRHHQLLDLLSLGEALDARARRAAHMQCMRPRSSPTDCPLEWWAYVGRCALLQRRREGGMRLTWQSLQQRRARRVAYLAASQRARGKNPSSEEMAALIALEASMEFDEIVTFRRIALQAHAARQEGREKPFGLGWWPSGSRSVDAAELSEEEIATLYAAMEASEAKAEEARSRAGDARRESGLMQHDGTAASYEQYRVVVSTAAQPMRATLYHTHSDPLISLVVSGVAARAAIRPVGSGMSLSLRVRSVAIYDLIAVALNRPEALQQVSGRDALSGWWQRSAPIRWKGPHSSLFLIPCPTCRLLPHTGVDMGGLWDAWSSRQRCR